jgi:predicted nucleic-acid-binding protein
MAKSSTASLDTNVLLRLVLNDVPEQIVAINKLLARGSKFEVSDAALIEMVFVLERSYKITRSVVDENLRFIIGHPQLVCNKYLFDKVLSLYVSAPTLSIHDCTLLWYARLNQKKPLYTFDKKLVSKSGGDAEQP